MSTSAPRRRSLFSLPRDYVQRRRFRRRMTNVILIPVLSLAAAYVITRPTGGMGLALPKGAQEGSLATPLQRESGALASTPISASISLASSTAILASSAAADPMLGGAYMLDPGPHSVSEVRDVAVHDAKRNKDLHARIFYPNEPGTYPVIVFSHGADGSQNCCDALTRHWASYGYVTLQPIDGTSALSRRNPNEEDVRFVEAVGARGNDSAKWESWPKDISSLLDALPTLPNRIPGLADKIDMSEIGVGGHSAGAFAADALAGALVNLPGHPGASFADGRVKAVLLLSPPGPGEFGLTDHSWDHVAIPLLSMTGSLDRGAGNQGPDWKEIPYERSQPGDKYLVYVRGASQTSFISAKSILPGRAAQGELILGYTNSACLAFWDAYLKGDLKAKLYLQSNALADFSRDAVKLLRR